MSLTSSSTLAQAVDQYKDNLSWEGNLTKAQAALEALRFIRLERPAAMGQFEMNIRHEEIAGEIERLQAFVKVGSSSRASFVRGRPRVL